MQQQLLQLLFLLEGSREVFAACPTVTLDFIVQADDALLAAIEDDVRSDLAKLNIQVRADPSHPNDSPVVRLGRTHRGVRERSVGVRFSERVRGGLGIEGIKNICLTSECHCFFICLFFSDLSRFLPIQTDAWIDVCGYTMIHYKLIYIHNLCPET